MYMYTVETPWAGSEARMPDHSYMYVPSVPIQLAPKLFQHFTMQYLEMCVHGDVHVHISVLPGPFQQSGPFMP